MMEDSPVQRPSACFAKTEITVDLRKRGQGMQPVSGVTRDGRVLVTRQFDLPVAGEPYTLSVNVDMTDATSLQQELIKRAYYDDLTGLPNRALMERTVKALIDGGPKPFALAFIDLDGFKRVNDYYGHSIGDQLLSALAARLGGMLRPSDMLARLSGDEFLLLLTPIRDQEDLTADLDWLLGILQDPFFIENHEILTSGSFGVALYPRDGTTYDTLRDNADRAMYWTKNGKKGSVRFFDSSISEAVEARHRLEQRVRSAVLQERVLCAYQPKFDFRHDRIAGVEVLMRWVDGDGLINGPAPALEIAAELGLMDQITHQMLDATVWAVDTINDAFGRGCSISLNVSPRQAGDFDFMRSFVTALERTGMAERFMLELTEEAFLATSQFQTHVLPLIRSIGARVSIDDFGVGYSSLSSLAAITADEVKVDRSFITNVHQRPRSQSILKAVEALGGSLGMSVVVEGVETSEELAYLRSATEIDFAQGFRFSRPILLEHERRLLAPASRSGRGSGLIRTAFDPRNGRVRRG